MIVVLGVLLVVVIAAVGWQHRRYVHARRGPVQDRQPLLYPARTFHVVTFLEVAANRDVIEDVRKLRDLLEGPGTAKMVYAGQGAFRAVESKQLPDHDWDAVILVQYPTREAYDAVARSESYRAALSGFASAYSHGMQRSAWMNLALPIALLGFRCVDRLKGVSYAFEPMEDGEALGGVERGAKTLQKFQRLEALRHLSEDAVVIVNLLKPGNREQRAADGKYTRAMLGAMAEMGYGPMHMGRAVTVEGEADFNRVAFVYYPGIDHMHEMIRSKFMNRIASGKQPGDSLAVATVPILSKL